jgi:integrase/recombinase XerD
MNALQTALDEYLAVRRALGAQLRHQGHLLQQFVEFATREGVAFITTALALRWATLPTDAQPTWWAHRLGVVRRFAEYVSAADPRTEVPPPGLLPYPYRRQPPYLYHDDEIRRLIDAARRLPGITGLRSHTYATLLALFAVTGMRTNEPLHLERDDVDLDHGILTVRQTKFGKSRYVPVHESTRQALERYAAHRDRLCPNPQCRRFFLAERGMPVTEWALRYTFVKLSRQTGLRGPADSHGPRLHDFRHRFAVETLKRWYRRGVDVEQRLPQLSTFLGHAHVTDTYWYLTAVPELLTLAARRLERTARRPTP